MIENGRLTIFNNFEVIVKKEELKEGVNIDIFSDAMRRDVGSLDWPVRESHEVDLTTYLHYIHQNEKTLYSWFRLKIAELLYKNKDKKIEVYSYKTIENFFKDVKETVKKLDINENSVAFYLDAIQTAKDNNQKALLEILSDKKDVVLKEIKLLSSFSEPVLFVDEDDIIKFYNKTNKLRTLKMTWIKNYVRLIPADVLENKKVFDKLDVFDNYVILHFDKNNTASKMTKEEVEKAKDPILFGVIKGSNKLYFVDDWIDEYCDLTLDKFLEVIQLDKAKELNNEEIKKTINR
jgi:hypothetical protein